MTVLARLPAQGRQAARARSAQTHPPTAYIRRRYHHPVPPAQTISIGIAGETDAGLAITVVQPGAQVIPIGIAEETDTALVVQVIAPNAGEPEGGLAFLFPTGTLVPTDQVIPIGLATETDEALAIDAIVPLAQVIAIGLAIESDEAFRITRLGGGNTIITMNMRMPPDTEIGAYFTHEWRGHLVPARGTGSYAGPVVETQSVDEYGEVTFLSLPPGEYVAWAADFPLRRRFFKITD